MDARLPVLSDVEGPVLSDVEGQNLDFSFGADAAPLPDAAPGLQPPVEQGPGAAISSPASGGGTADDPAIRPGAVGHVPPPEPVLSEAGWPGGDEGPDADDLVYEPDDAPDDLGPPDAPADDPDAGMVPPELALSDVEGPVLSDVEGPAALEADLALAARILASPAAGEFMSRRIELQRRHGARASTDPARDPYMMARELEQRAVAVCDHLRGRSPRTADALAAARISAIGAGALALALYDAITAELAAAQAREPAP